jgi:hypothetical protein
MIGRGRLGSLLAGRRRGAGRRHAGPVHGICDPESIFVIVMATQYPGRRKPGRAGKGDRTQATIRFPTALYTDLKAGAGEAGWPEFSDYVAALCAAARAADIKPTRASARTGEGPGALAAGSSQRTAFRDNSARI